MSDWIPVSERLPGYGKHVLMVISRQQMDFVVKGYRTHTDSSGENWGSRERVVLNTDVTHWMPLPEPPK